MLQFAREHGVCLVVITHDLSLLRELDHIFVMDKGKVVHSGTHRQLLQEKAKVYLQFMFPYQKPDQDADHDDKAAQRRQRWSSVSHHHSTPSAGNAVPGAATTESIRTEDAAAAAAANDAVLLYASDSVSCLR